MGLFAILVVGFWTINWALGEFSESTTLAWNSDMPAGIALQPGRSSPTIKWLRKE